MNQIERIKVYEKFERELAKAGEAIKKAAELYVKTIDENPEMKKAFRERYPDICPGAWTKMDRIGRGLMDPRLITVGSPNFDPLRHLPYDEQKRLIDDPHVELLPDKDASDEDRFRIPVKELTASQVEQIFDKKGGVVRSVDEQRRWLLQREFANRERLERWTASTARPYEIIRKNGRPVAVRVRRCCDIDIKELLNEVL